VHLRLKPNPGNAMAKHDKLQGAIDELSALRSVSDPALLSAKLSAAIKQNNGILVARAIKIVRERKIESIIETLPAVFDRFIDNGAKTDPGCGVKNEIVRALLDRPERCEELYVNGTQLIQMEGGYGPPTDTAAELRGLCAMGLVCIASRQSMRAVTSLLFDPQKTTRQMAVKCAITAGSDAAALLLRAKTLAGDTESEITGDALAGIMQIEKTQGLTFVQQFLFSDDESLAESAALAIGELRSPEAFDLLSELNDDVLMSRLRGALLLAMALTRDGRAVDLMIRTIEKEHIALASDAVRAAAIYRGDETIRDRVTQAVRARRDAGLIVEWEDAIKSARA